MSAKTEARLLEGSKILRARPPRRMRLGQAQEIVDRVTGSLRNVPGVKAMTALARTGGGAKRSRTSTCWSRQTSPPR